MMQLLTAAQMLFASLREDERGATMVEYGLIVGLIAVVVVVGATVLGLSVSDLFGRTAQPFSRQASLIS